MKNTVASILFLMLLGGCVSNGPIRDLGKKEKDVIQKLNKRLADNKPIIESATKVMGDLGAQYEEYNFALELSLAKSKRLDSMQSFLSSPPDEFRETQRAVILYHLYEVELAEQKVLQARMAERRASVQEIATAYAQLGKILSDATKNLEVLLKHVNRPKNARIVAFTDTFLGEVKTFRTTLAESDNPRLKELASEVEAFEIRAEKAKQDATSALQLFTSSNGS